MLERGALAGLNHLLSQQPLGGGAPARPLPDRASKSAALRSRTCASRSWRAACSSARRPGRRARSSSSSRPAPCRSCSRGDEAARSQIEIEGPGGPRGRRRRAFPHLAWDVEEDLSTVFGDVVAHRLASGGRAFAAWQRDAVAAARRKPRRILGRGAAACCCGLPTRRNSSREVDALRERLARLEKRIERLDQTAKR